MDSVSLNCKRINDQFQKRMQVLSALLFWILGFQKSLIIKVIQMWLLVIMHQMNFGVSKGLIFNNISLEQKRPLMLLSMLRFSR